MNFYATNRHIEGYTKVLPLSFHILTWYFDKKDAGRLHEPVPLGFGAVSGTVWYYKLAFANDNETG